MSILKRLENLCKQNCLNCIYIDVLPDEPLSTRYDCFYPDKLEVEYYWEAWKENSCKHFKRKELK